MRKNIFATLMLLFFICILAGNSYADATSWEEWKDKNGWYFEEIEKISEEYRSADMNLSEVLMEARQQHINNIVVFTEKFEKITPPSELRIFHKKTIELGKMEIKGLEASRIKDRALREKCMIDINNTLSITKQELKKLFTKYKTPPEEVRSIEESTFN